MHPAHLLLFVFLIPTNVQTLQISGNETVHLQQNLQGVQDIAVDSYICGNFLIATRQSVLTSDLNSSRELYSSTSDQYYRGIYQRSPIELFFSEYFQNCIIQLDRTTDQGTMYAGYCGQTGTTTGHRLTSRFHSIIDIKEIRSDLLLIVDRNNHRLVYIDMETEQTSVAVSGGHLVYPSLISLHPTDPNLIYVTAQNKIIGINLAMQQQTLFAGGNGLADGELSTAGFSSSVWQLTFINNNKGALVTDGDGGLRLIDLVENKVNTLCSYNSQSFDGKLGACTFNGVKKQLVVGQQLYLTHSFGVSLIETSYIAGDEASGIRFTNGKCSFSNSCGLSDVLDLVRNRPECAEHCLMNQTSCLGFQYRNNKCRLINSGFAEHQLPKDGMCYLADRN